MVVARSLPQNYNLISLPRQVKVFQIQVTLESNLKFRNLNKNRSRNHSKLTQIQQKLESKLHQVPIVTPKKILTCKHKN